MRCVYLNRAGEQCWDPALEGGQFCAHHAQALEEDTLDESLETASPERTRAGRFPLAYRIAAVILLWILLYQTFGSVRAWLDW